MFLREIKFYIYLRNVGCVCLPVYGDYMPFCDDNVCLVCILCKMVPLKYQGVNIFLQASPMKSPGKSPKKSPAKSPRSGKKQSPVFKVPRGKPPGTNTKKLSPKKLEFGNRSRIRRNVREVVRNSLGCDVVSQVFLRH